MSSVIELYEHNQKAYDALLDMLGERDRACIIKPTGTGKFVIIAKMVQDNPDKRFLLLGTNDYMFNDQMANLAEIAPGFTPENLQFMTYAAAEAFISTHGNEVNDEEDGIGSVIYWTVEVERRVEYKENEWLPCDESGRIDDGYGNEPNATVAYLSSLEGSREERAFELAKNEYLAWLEHKEDRYTTVYGYID